MGWKECRQCGVFAVVTLCFSEACGVEQMQAGNKQLKIDRPIEQLECAIRPGREVPVMCGVWERKVAGSDLARQEIPAVFSALENVARSVPD
jgi:hypothetical protein